MNKLYAIVDIETTGGQQSNGSITEVAICIHDGEKVINQYEWLVRPFYRIPRYITALTGIDNEMVSDCPTFEALAEEINEILKDKIFVAHNVNFDYSFIKQHLKNAGIEFNASKLCTVRLSRKVFPGLRSYSLGNICAYLNIDIEHRHRAGGDAAATAKLFSLILENNKENVLEKMLKPKSGEHNLPPNLAKDAIDKLPESPGVYFFHDEKSKVIYIGKALNIRKRVKSHFSGNKITKQRQDFLRDIHSISFEACATELMALVLEALEIKKTWPKYNRALKGFEPKYGLFSYLDQNNFLRLFIGKFNKSLLPIRSFYDLVSARNFLQKLVDTHQLCPELCKVGDCELCKEEQNRSHRDAHTYNQLVSEALAAAQQESKSFFIKDEGRNKDEYSLIMVEPGVFYAMGYLPQELALSDVAAIRHLLNPFEGTYYLNQLLQKFAKEHPNKISYFQ